jgi:hypothetical protein
MGRWTVMLWALGACADPPDIAPLEEAPVDTTDTTDTVVDTPQVDTPAPDTADTGDTAAGPSFDPFGFFVEVWFGYDPVADSTGLFTFDTVVSRTLYQVFIFDEAWDGQYASTADYCVVRFVAQTDQPRATWLSGFGGYTFGFSRPQVVVDGDCDGRLGRSKPADVEQRVADPRRQLVDGGPSAGVEAAERVGHLRLPCNRPTVGQLGCRFTGLLHVGRFARRLTLARL